MVGGVGGNGQILHCPVPSKEYEIRLFSLLISQDSDFIIFLHYYGQNPFSSIFVIYLPFCSNNFLTDYWGCSCYFQKMQMVAIKLDTAMAINGVIN